MKSMQSELGSLREEQTAQQVERNQVLEGLKRVEAVTNKLNQIEAVQESHGNRLTMHDDAIKRNKLKAEEGEKRIDKLEEKMLSLDQKPFDMRHCNAVAREVREMEKREKNIVLFNVPESTDKEEEERKQADMEKVANIFKELGFPGLQPTKLVRIGTTGKYARKILVSLKTVDECERVVKKGKENTLLNNGVFVTRDRTYNQRQEARLFRLEKEREEREGTAASTGGVGRGGGGVRGGGRGRGRIKGSI